LFLLCARRVKVLPEGFFSACGSLVALWLRGNPITVAALRAAPGFEAYEARRRARTDKQLGGRVMADIGRAFCEGGDVETWEHWKK
jgi:1,4-dihydroxy-2-naphthoyl-CoA synthase